MKLPYIVTFDVPLDTPGGVVIEIRNALLAAGCRGYDDAPYLADPRPNASDTSVTHWLRAKSEEHYLVMNARLNAIARTIYQPCDVHVRKDIAQPLG